MRQIDKETKEKRSKVYYSKARIKPTYIFLVVPIFVGLAMGIDEFLETKMWGKALVYVLSLGTISSALFFLLRLVLRDISLVYPGKILFCNRLNSWLGLTLGSLIWPRQPKDRQWGCFWTIPLNWWGSQANKWLA